MTIVWHVTLLAATMEYHKPGNQNHFMADVIISNVPNHYRRPPKVHTHNKTYKKRSNPLHCFLNVIRKVYVGNFPQIAFALDLRVDPISV
jgi:hypothetical protein